MSRISQENGWGRRVRWLTQMLILSVTVNIGFIATWTYSLLQERQGSFALNKREESFYEEISLQSNEELLRNYFRLSFEELLCCLEEEELVEEGYKKRDLALACLVAFHHFNIERALGGLALQERKMAFAGEEGQEVIDLSIFPGLANYQFQAILHYAKTEKWPLTTRGLFFALVRGEEGVDSSLLDAFSLTPEYHALFTLFGRSGTPLSRDLLVALCKGGGWQLLARIAEEQRLCPDFSPERRRVVLLSYLQLGSHIAAELLLQTDSEFIAKRFSDEQMLFLLERIGVATPGLEGFSRQLLFSLRSDAVLEEAARKLYALAQESCPEPYDHCLALKRFAPELAVASAPEPPAATPPPPEKLVYIVQPGDSLWKVARKHNTSVERLMRCNRLESERLRPGQPLEIP